MLPHSRGRAVLLATVAAVLMAGPAAARAQQQPVKSRAVPAAAAAVAVPAVIPGAIRLTRGEAEVGPGAVVLELGAPREGDPPDLVRLQAILLGPLQVKEADDLFAVSAVLRFSAAHLAFVPGSVEKGELLGRDGRETLITAGVRPGIESRLTIGASRLGAVPGVQAPAAPAVLFSLALRILDHGDSTLAWEEAAFINSSVRPVDGARFIGGTLHVEEQPAAGSKEN